MRILSKPKLVEFWGMFPEAKNPLENWFRTVSKADWNSFADVKNTFRSADLFGDCAVFNIGGNKYRLIAKIRYRTKKVFVRFILIHSEYDMNKWKDDCNSS
ncbi:MAG TPA: type II toxin-antitoxin system HigB family toxin [Pyrinomonadaceae bacterium]|jgi:mRNA interferase HigB